MKDFMQNVLTHQYSSATFCPNVLCPLQAAEMHHECFVVVGVVVVVASECHGF